MIGYARVMESAWFITVSRIHKMKNIELQYVKIVKCVILIGVCQHADPVIIHWTFSVSGKIIVSENKKFTFHNIHGIKKVSILALIIHI